MTDDIAQTEPESFTPATHRPPMQQLLDTVKRLTEHEQADPRYEQAYYRMQHLWNHPYQYEDGEHASFNCDSTSLIIFELAVAFGIEFERAYPSGEHERWPVPLEDRQSPRTR